MSLVAKAEYEELDDTSELKGMAGVVFPVFAYSYMEISYGISLKETENEETIILHKRMLLNPRYGPVGTVAFPYFIILELYGYVNLLLGVILGVVSTQVAMLLLITVILYGILISLGFRQVISAIRVTAYISYLFKDKPWGSMERKGFQNTPPRLS
jgi:hypothetical protein